MVSNEAIINNALNWALKEVGTVDIPGNRYWNIVGVPSYSGQPWCAAFVTCAYLKADADFRHWTDNPYFVNNFQAYASQIGAWKTDNPQAGDLVCYDWQDGGIRGDHIGISYPEGQANTYTAIEGNTDDSGSGNGGCVAIKHRSRDSIWGWVDINTLLNNMREQGWIASGPTRLPNVGGVPSLPQPFPLPSGHYYGLITGPDESHGGINAAEKSVIKIIQQRLIAKGYVPGVTDVNSPWADGIFEQPTADAVARFQHAEMPGTQYFGQVWADDYAQLSR